MWDPMKAETLTRADVRVSRRYGWVVNVRDDSIVGCVWRDVNAAGKPIWKAQASDVSSFDFTHGGAVLRVLAMHNMHEKARAYDLISRVAIVHKPGPNVSGSVGSTDETGCMVWRKAVPA